MQTRTFLFSDLRDYTRFVETHGDAATKILIADYRSIVRGEVAKHDGAEIKTEGDSFYVVFASARQAVACAIAIAREAERYSRLRPDRPVRVGIGIHAGEPEPHEGQFVGAAVIVAARLAQTAGAGEVLLTEVVRALIPRDALPPMHERDGIALKGISEPPRVFAVDWQQAPEPVRAPAPAAPATAEAAPPQSHQVLCPEIIGRDTEIAALEALLADAAAGRGRVALIGGEAGLGKSALLRRFLDGARASGARVLVGECTEVEARRPFGPVIDALENAGIPLPEAFAQGGPGAQPLAESETYRVHAGFASALEDAARAGPVVFAIEDLHWGDPATLELVPYLARKLRADRVLLVATYRTDELHRRHPINHVLAELARGRLATDVRLRPLSEDEAAAVIKAALGLQRAPTSAFRRAIQDRCAGNPFFIEEVLASLVERGDLEYRSGAWRRSKEMHEITLPVSVRDAVEQRLAGLSATALRAAHVGAVIGQRFGFELLRDVTGMTEHALLDALREAVDVQLVQEEGDETYRFRHALTREAVLEELMAREKRILHRQVGEAIEARADAGERTEELAYHFDEARDTDRARRYHELAAERAERAFAYASALAHRERALELMPDDDPALADGQLRLAWAAYHASEFGRSARAADEARAAFDARGDTRRAAEARVALAWARGMSGDMAAERRLADEAIAALEPLGPSPELARAYTSRSRRAMLDRTPDAVALGRKAMSIAEAVGDTESWVNAATSTGSALGSAGEHAEGIALVREAVRVGEREQLVASTSRALNNLIVNLTAYGAPFEESDRVIDQFVAHVRRYGLHTTTIATWLAFPAFRDGDWDRALAAIDEYRDESVYSTTREMIEAVIRVARDGPDAGIQRVAEIRGRLLATGEPQSIAAAATWSSLTHFLVGDMALTLRDLEAAIAADVASIGGPFGSGAVTALLAAMRLRDAAAAEQWAQLVAQSKRTPGGRDRVAPLTQLAGAANAYISGDRERALAGLAAGAPLLVSEARGHGAAALVWLERARLLVEYGRREEAEQDLERGLAYFRTAKALWYIGQVAEWAASAGLRAAVTA